MSEKLEIPHECSMPVYACIKVLDYIGRNKEAYMHANLCVENGLGLRNSNLLSKL